MMIAGCYWAAGLIAATFTPMLEETESARIQIDVAVYRGDPLGDQESGNVYCIAEPRMITRLGKPARFMTSQAQLSLTIMPLSMSDSGVRLEIVGESTSPPDRRGAEIVTQTSRTTSVRLLKEGEVRKVRLHAMSPVDQIWAEVSAKVVDGP